MRQRCAGSYASKTIVVFGAASDSWEEYPRVSMCCSLRHVGPTTRCVSQDYIGTHVILDLLLGGISQCRFEGMYETVHITQTSHSYLPILLRAVIRVFS